MGRRAGLVEHPPWPPARQSPTVDQRDGELAKRVRILATDRGDPAGGSPTRGGTTPRNLRAGANLEGSLTRSSVALPRTARTPPTRDRTPPTRTRTPPTVVRTMRLFVRTRPVGIRKTLAVFRAPRSVDRTPRATTRTTPTTDRTTAPPRRPRHAAPAPASLPSPAAFVYRPRHNTLWSQSLSPVSAAAR